jgi:hypothetical protein
MVKGKKPDRILNQLVNIINAVFTQAYEGGKKKKNA